jgi:hypothetical protein
MSKKIIASLLSALMAVVGLAAPVLAAYLSEYPTFLPEIPYIVVGEDAKPEDVISAADIAIGLAELSTEEKTAVAAVAAAEVTGGVSLDTADSRLYLSYNTNAVKQMLTSTDLPTLLASGTVEDTAGTKYTYSMYLGIGQKEIQYAQPDVTGGKKEPDYLIKLGTSAGSSSTAHIIRAWVTFSKEFNASKAVGKTLTLFGKEFTISSETDTTELVLFGIAGKDTIEAGETKTITVGETEYTVTLVGVVDEDTAILEVDGVRKEVDEDNTYDFAGTSVYVEDVFYYKVPEETGSIVISIGAERYVFQNGQSVKKGTAGAEETVKGTYVSLSTSPQQLSELSVYFDAYSATPAVDYIEAGTTWADPIFEIKVAYDGPASIDSEEILVQPGASNYYTITFTDKYGYSGTITWAYDSDVTSAGGESLQDEIGEPIHILENETAELSEYLFAASSTFPHMLKITSIEITEDGTDDVAKITFRDVFSGTEYKVDKSGDLGTLTSLTLLDDALVIDGVKYDVWVQDVTAGDKAALVRDGATNIVVYPVIPTKYGATIALTDDKLVGDELSSDTIYVVPTGYINISSIGGAGSNDWATVSRSTDGTTYTTVATVNTTSSQEVSVQLGRVYYIVKVGIGATAGDGAVDVTFYLDGEQDSDTGDGLVGPAVLIVEEETKVDNADAFVLNVTNDATTDKRLELQTPVYTHASTNIYAGVGTESTYITHYLTEWGSKIVYDTTAAGTATITYPDTQVYHLIAVGEAPEWEAVTGEVTYEEFVPVTTSIALLDTEVTDAHKAKSMILVGGPAVNRLTAEVWGLDYPTYGAESGIPEGKAVIEILDSPWTSGKYVVVVAGWEAENTRAAALALLQHATQLVGIDASKAIIEGTVATGITVTAA